MATYSIGKIGLNPRGNYSATQVYNRLDVVSDGVCSYVCLEDNCQNCALTDAAAWMVLSDGFNAQDRAQARSILGISTGTSLPEEGEYNNGDIFFLYS